MMSKLIVAVLLGMLALPVIAAEAPRVATTTPLATTASPVAVDGVQAKATPVPSAAGTPTGVAVDASSQCEVVAASNAAEIAELKKQIMALQQQILNQSGVAGAGMKDYSIRIKNLPRGSYRDRCFACMSAADEDGERVLLCTCPTGDNTFDRLSITLSKCHAEEEISYCAGMLMCGPCHLNNNLRNELPEQKKSDSSNVDNLDKLLNPKK
jgi:hypothetical protein